MKHTNTGEVVSCCLGELKEVAEEVTLTWILNDGQEQGQPNWTTEI